MIYLVCLLGVIIGAVVGFSWCRLQIAAQLQTIIDLLDYGQSEQRNLSAISQLRRSAVSLNRQRLVLADELKTWQDLWQAAPIGYLHLNSENQILWCNTLAQRLLQIDNWQPDRLLLEVVRSYELDRLIDQTRLSQNTHELEWQFYPSYADRPVNGIATSLKATAIALPNQAVVIFLENLQPLVMLRQTRERWTTDLAHELRTPLTSMRLVAETIQSQVEPPIHQLSGRMVQEIDRLARLVQDFLELSQLEQTPDKIIRRETVYLARVIDQAWQGLEPLARQKSVILTEQGDVNIKLQADPGRLAQVLINLLDNALKYSPFGGQIEVKTQLQNNIVEIDVIDAGCGFAATDLPHVFDRLFRSDASRHHVKDSVSITTGNGLGLAIVKQIVLAHGGAVTAQNHPKTGGAWLQIKLPLN